MRLYDCRIVPPRQRIAAMSVFTEAERRYLTGGAGWTVGGSGGGLRGPVGQLLPSNQADAPCASNLVWIRSGLTAATLQPPLRLNAALNSSWLIGCRHRYQVRRH
jgi:hypothetical protein